ncbi:MAG: transglutaminase-like domain-containing protein [Candidatus Hodarchaeales archaeon]
MIDRISNKHRAIILIILFIVSYALNLANLYQIAVYDSSSIIILYDVEFSDQDKLNYFMIPSGDIGRNGSQSVSVYMEIEGINTSIYDKYTNGTAIISYPHATRRIDGTGTPWINISLRELEEIPRREISVYLFINRFLTGSSYRDTNIDETKWLQPTKYIDSNHSSIITKAGELKSPGQTRKNRVVRIVSFVKNEIQYNKSLQASDHWIDNDTYYGEENGKASDTLEIKQGVCIHFARLCAALCRASGVPARLVLGYYLYEDDVFKSKRSELHAWVEYHYQQEWHFVEPRERNHGIYPAQYVHLISGPMQEDSFYIESKYPNMCVLDEDGNGHNSYVDEYDSHEDYEKAILTLVRDKNSAGIYLALLSLSLALPVYIAFIKLYKVKKGKEL